MDGTLVKAGETRIAAHIWPVEMSNDQKRELDELLQQFLVKHWPPPDRSMIRTDYEE
jgi:hypothetical protein